MQIKKLIPGVIRKAAKQIRKRNTAVKPQVGHLQQSERPLLPVDGAIGFGPVRVLSVKPPVFLSGIPYDKYLGVAGEFARHYGNVKAGFIIFPTWSIEQPGRPEAIKQCLLDHCSRYPNHKFRFICNTRKETGMLLEVGVSAEFLNKNFTVSEQIFRPMRRADVAFDAIYVARLVPEKRHELAAAVPCVGYVAYMEFTRDDHQQRARLKQFQELHEGMLTRNARHVLLNEISDGLPVAMTHKQVNAALSRASVGLILSEVEGSSYASMEYMLAGLPVVSTPSKGGRDVFFDPEFCLVCEPDPAAVRDAVAELRARNIPREVIRARTLAKIQPERARFLSLVDDLIEDLGGERRYSGGDWPFGDVSGVPWRYFSLHLDEYASRLRSDLCDELGLKAEMLEGVQLEAAELRPIVSAIKERPGCSLLVFGCGRDSPFWEKVNRSGTTAFLEDNPEWAAQARARLTSATVHNIRYGTKLPQWRRLLNDPSQLGLDLPEEIRARKWDVILVDGPAGYSDSQPGRMKSIYTASRLVAPGGRVFVHDCERPAEQAFASRYLGDGRSYLEVKGRAVLRGYAF
ncbi:MAG: glycosyltransferase [Hyphomicrobiaceae bacterium]